MLDGDWWSMGWSMILSTYHNDNQKERTDETRERKEENTIGTKQKEKDVTETKRYYCLHNHFDDLNTIIQSVLHTKQARKERSTQIIVQEWYHCKHATLLRCEVYSWCCRRSVCCSSWARGRAPRSLPSPPWVPPHVVVARFQHIPNHHYNHSNSNSNSRTHVQDVLPPWFSIKLRIVMLRPEKRRRRLLERRMMVTTRTMRTKL